MSTIKDILIKYHARLDSLDLELIIARVLKKPREFVLSHPEYRIPATDNLRLITLINRKMRHEPLAYILGEKEFYGLKFKVNKNVLIPRPETEQIVELVTQNLKCENKNTLIVDIGTGSGNVIIAVVKQLRNYELGIRNYEFYGLDISKKALAIARKNAKLHKVDKKIKFLHGNLLEPIIKRCFMFHAPCFMTILANLPYLSPALFRQSQISVKMYEPKKALLAGKNGLFYYEAFIRQIKELKDKCFMFQVACFMEISPEQKPALQKLIKKYFPKVVIKFHKDLANKWRVCNFEF